MIPFEKIARLSVDRKDARAVMRETRSADVFVTLTGQKMEGALGWLTDDLLKGA
jgi:hypothetical protein